MNIFCTICCDVFDEHKKICAARCGHVFHDNCLCKWMNQVKTCPHCRRKIAKSELIKLFFDFQQMNNVATVGGVTQNLSTLAVQLMRKDDKMKEERQKFNDLASRFTKMKNIAKHYKQKMVASESREGTLKLEVQELNRQIKLLKSSEERSKIFGERMPGLERIETAVLGSPKEGGKMLAYYGEESDAKKELVSCCSILKREVKNLRDSSGELKRKISMLRSETKLMSSSETLHKSENTSLDELIMKLSKEKEALEYQIHASKINDTVNPVNESPNGKAKRPFSKTPTDNKIILEPSKKLKVQLASYENSLKNPESGP